MVTNEYLYVHNLVGLFLCMGVEWINLALCKENRRAITDTAMHLTRNSLQLIQVLTTSNERAVIILIIKPRRCTNFSNLFLE